MKLNRIASLLVLMAGLAGTLFGQTALTQTTLSTAQSSPITPSLTLAACTGITAPLLPGTPTSVIYVGGEAEGILTWNTSTCSGSAIRGYLGTRANGHPSGDMVLVGVVYQTTLAQGGNPTPSGLYDRDPGYNGSCTASATATTPYLNVLSSAQWLCSTVTGTWVPGWQNPYLPAGAKVTAAVASAAGQVTPSGPLFHITGTAAITGFLIPVGFDATAYGGGQFCVIPDGAFTTTTANNIAIASTAVVNKLLCWTWDATNSKFVPSY